MLRNTNDLAGHAIRATDGDIGRVKDFYFDDKAWVIRYLVVDAGSWLSSRNVLISPIAVGHPDWAAKVFPVSITKEQVRNSPDIETGKPVSRQHEVRYHGYFGYPFYWDGGGLWGPGSYPGLMMPGYVGFAPRPDAERIEAEKVAERHYVRRHRDDDPHLRSCEAVMRYRVEATDGDIGHVQGLLVDEETWAIRYIVVDTSNWWLGHKVLVAPQWIRDVSWSDSSVRVDLTRQAVKDAPPYDPAVPLERSGERGLHEHHERAGYWTVEKNREAEAAHR